MDMWLSQKAAEVRDAWEPLVHKKIVGILFYAARIISIKMVCIMR